MCPQRSLCGTAIYVIIGQNRVRVCTIVFRFDDFFIPCIMHPLEL